MDPLHAPGAVEAPPPAYTEEPEVIPAPDLITAALNEPPAYRSAPSLDADELLPPCTFVLRGRSIHAASPPYHLGARDEDQPILYQLSRAIQTPQHFKDSIGFERFDCRLRGSSIAATNSFGIDGNATTASAPAPAPATVSVSSRPRELYTLHHRIGGFLADFGLPPKLVSQASRKVTLGEVQIELRRTGRFLQFGFRAVRLFSESEKKRRGVEREGTKKKAKDQDEAGEVLFGIKGSGEKWEWSDAEGRRVARQSGGSGSGAERECVLSVEVPLPRRLLDGLVALWCLWMWQRHADEAKSRKTLEDRKRVMRRSQHGPRRWFGVK